MTHATFACFRPPAVAVSLCLVTFALWPASAHAFDPSDLGFSVVGGAELGKSKPLLVFKPSVNVKGVRVELGRDDGVEKTLKVGSLRRGRTRKVEIPQGSGVFRYTGKITGKAGREAFGFTVEFEVRVGRPPRISLSTADVDLEARTLTVRLSEPAGKLELEVLGAGGVVDTVVQELHGEKPGTPLTIGWTEAAAAKMSGFRLKAWDPAGYWSGVESVTFVDIPHEDIVFESGKADIRPSEEPKLKEPLGRIREELAKVQGVLPITLYVAGYTDTVGSKADNRKLSLARARSIATWFRKHGVKAPIRFQGFGEDVLFVQTPDDTDEARNRRAVYVLSAGVPPAGRGFPGTRWQSLR